MTTSAVKTGSIAKMSRFFMQKPFFVVGQTAAGKTEIAIALAERYGGEIVGADAFQVYAGLDLLTAKPTTQDRVRVPHHLIGTVPLAEPYNVARFRTEALRCIAEIQTRGQRPIVAGGSGLYVKALTHGLSPLPSADAALRTDLEALDTAALLVRLRALDPACASAIDTRNKRRLVRAVEVCLASGKPFSEQRNHWSGDAAEIQNAGVFLFRDRPDLHARIEVRVESIFAAGVVDEVRAVPEPALGPTAQRIIGLTDIRLHLAGEISLAACRERIKAATRQYAKRQMTWFKRERMFRPVNLSLGDAGAQLAAIMEEDAAAALK
jgi:tRNA dimethylallyltransferase